jgi:hypothetical protein
LWLIGEVARLTTSTDIESLRMSAVVDMAVVDWANEQLADPEGLRVYEWRSQGPPGSALLDQALIDCFDLVPDLFGAVWPIPSPWPRRWQVGAAAAAATPAVRSPGSGSALFSHC